MKRGFIATGLAAVLALALYDARPADASQYRVCAPIRSGAGGSTSFLGSSGTTYRTDSRGCVNIDVADLGSASALGYSIVAPFGTVAVKGMTSTPTTLQLPAGTFISQVIAEETSGTSLRHGIKIGTTSGGADVVSGLTLAASSVNTSSPFSLLKRAFSRTQPQTLYIDALGAETPIINNSLNVTIIYGYF